MGSNYPVLHGRIEYVRLMVLYKRPTDPFLPGGVNGSPGRA